MRKLKKTCRPSYKNISISHRKAGFPRFNKKFDKYIQPDFETLLNRFMSEIMAIDKYGLYVYGDFGTGKTWLITYLSKVYMYYTGVLSIYLTGAGFKQWLFKHDYDIQRLERHPLLIVDDVFETEHDYNTLGILTDLIDFRYRQKSPIIISSNTKPDEIVEMAGYERIADRILDRDFFIRYQTTNKKLRNQN
jgi:DNA replication protein DnaC